MACHLSIFAVFLLVSATTFVSAKTATCKIERFGALTMFNGETADVKIPCKYRLADFTCNDYHVQVTPGSARDGSDKFSPKTTWVKITNLTNGEFFLGRTSDKRIQDHINNDSVLVWDRKGGNLRFDREDYLSGEQYARLLITDKVKVQFAISGSHWGVKVKCTYDIDDDFVSEDYPASLCGNKSSTNVISSRKEALFSSSSVIDEFVIMHDVLDHTNVVQSSEECEDAAEDFRNCENSQPESIQTCGPTFTNTTLAGCLINDNNKLGRFHKCVKLACNNNMATCAAKLQSFKDYVELKCGTGTYASSTFSALSCS